MSGSNALTIPRDPTVLVNPLAAMDAGVRSAGTLMDVQSKQGEQLVGQALQQATDPETGVLDTQKAQRIAAGMGPNAAFAMQGFLKTGSQLRGEQITQAGALDNLTSTLAASAISDSSDENMARIRARGVANNLPPSALAEIDRIAALPEGQRKLEAWKHLSGQMGAGYGLAAGGFPTPQITQMPQGAVGINVTPKTPYGPATVSTPGGVGAGLSPADLTKPATWTDAQGNPRQGTHGDYLIELGRGNVVGPAYDPTGRPIMLPPSGGGGLNAAGDSATRKAAEGGPPAPGTPAAAAAQRTHDFWISQGYNEAQVAGILAGGPGSESNFDPAAAGDKVNGVPTSIGLYQHHGVRLANMQKFFGLPAGQMPTEQQQNQYAAWEISPQGPLAAVGARLKQAKTPAEAAAIWTQFFGVPADKSEIARRANGASRFQGIYGQPQGPPEAQAGPPGVQMGGVPPAPPGGAAGPYTGGGIGSVLGPRSDAAPPANTNVAAILQGMQNARANPLLGGAMTAGPGAPTGNNALAGPSVELPPQPGWGTDVGSYSGGPGAAPPVAAAPARPAAVAPVAAAPPAAQPTAQPGGSGGVIAPSGAHYIPGPPLGTGERVQADITAYTKDSSGVATHQGAINTLQNAYKALQLADTGPGTQNLQAARAFLQSFGIATSATGDQATQWAEAHKYLMDYARTQGLLGGTDLQAQLAQGSNASTDIPKPAALAVVRTNIAKERMAIAQVQEASGSGGYVDHTKNFAPSQDLRAYQADIMPPAELKEIEALQKSNPTAFKKFQKSLDIARAHGLIFDEDLAAQNQRIRAMGRP